MDEASQLSLPYWTQAQHNTPIVDTTQRSHTGHNTPILDTTLPYWTQAQHNTPILDTTLPYWTQRSHTGHNTPILDTASDIPVTETQTDTEMIDIS